MPRHKMRKANAALNKGQMVRLINERVVYVPPPLGRCCRYSDDNILIGCSDVTEAECCCSQNNEDCELGYGDCGYAVWDGNLDCTTPCTQDKGACCVDGSCSQQTPQDCEALNGYFFGVNVDCDVANCTDCGTPEECCPKGRCCYGDGCATGIRECECLNSGGQWTEGAECPDCSSCENETGPCCPEVEGLCCGGGSCSGVTTRCNCQGEGKVFRPGEFGCPDCDTDFNPDCCPEPITGACCNTDTFECTEVEKGQCPDGSVFRPGTSCTPDFCQAPPPLGRCCKRCPPVTCDDPVPLATGVYGGQVTEEQCNGRWTEIDNDDCGGCPQCPDPTPTTGACCGLDGICRESTPDRCGGQFLGLGSICTEGGPFGGDGNPCITNGDNCRWVCYETIVYVGPEFFEVTWIGYCTNQPPTSTFAMCALFEQGDTLCDGGDPLSPGWAETCIGYGTYP